MCEMGEGGDRDAVSTKAKKKSDEKSEGGGDEVGLLRSQTLGTTWVFWTKTWGAGQTYLPLFTPCHLLWHTSWRGRAPNSKSHTLLEQTTDVKGLWGSVFALLLLMIIIMFPQ